MFGRACCSGWVDPEQTRPAAPNQQRVYRRRERPDASAKSSGRCCAQVSQLTARCRSCHPTDPLAASQGRSDLRCRGRGAARGKLGADDASARGKPGGLFGCCSEHFCPGRGSSKANLYAFGRFGREKRAAARPAAGLGRGRMLVDGYQNPQYSGGVVGQCRAAGPGALAHSSRW